VIVVRPAVAADVPAMSAVLTASIRDLCTADHRGDPAIISSWTANKTPDAVRKMLANSDLRTFVAERDGSVAAVGAVTTAGEVALNYVAPASRFRGISRALLAFMEADMRAAGIADAKLTSTETAHRFYLAAGWGDSGPVETDGFVPGYPMRKHL
jgi:GNAT superfamily N-acetyltransferase